MPDDECRNCIYIDNLNEHLVYYWVEAEVPIPTTLTIDGVATEAEPHG
jgi:hypothetical protein